MTHRAENDAPVYEHYCSECGECDRRGAHAYWCSREPDRDPLVVAKSRAPITAWHAEVKYIRLQVDGHTVAEFRNGSRACSCGLERGTTPDLRSVIPPEVTEADHG